MSDKAHTTKTGGTYFCTNSFGWACAANPFEAMAKLDLTYQGTCPKVGSSTYDKAVAAVNLWYLPSEEHFDHVDNYEPRTKAGEPAGVPLFVGTSEHNTKIVDKYVGHAASRYSYFRRRDEAKASA